MTTKPSRARQIGVGIAFVAAVTVVALAGSLATLPNVTGWYAHVDKVSWSPPNWIFGPAWSILYLTIALSGWIIWRSGWRQETRNDARSTLTLFWTQLAVNAVWTPVFFAGYPLVGEPAWWAALAIILILIALVTSLVVAARKHSKPASYLLLPYLFWLVFACSLNAGIIALN